MAPAKGNKFWQRRAKHGRDKLFTTAMLLWEAACEYFTACDKDPLIEIQYNGKDARRCRVPKMRPYTLTGLCIYLDCHSGYFREFKAALSNKKDATEEDKAFTEVIHRIEDIIYTQKFEGAAAGFFNGNIIARDLGLVDKTDNKVVVRNFDVSLDLS